LFILTLASGKFGVGLPKGLQVGGGGEHSDGFLECFQIVDGEQNRRRPAVDCDRDALMLGAYEGDQFR